uniref:interleukin-1 receptor type 1-like isoform X2 n=1 Tax=Monopterus albus TaxID=43700 RepID=UPI0009B34743|nr:interleukin-1 receptor type 1-like isoform X2 [Monopterus albus]
MTEKCNLFNPTDKNHGSGRLGLPVGCAAVSGFFCGTQDKTGLWRVKLGVSVSSGECPEPPQNKSITKGVSGALPCQQPEIFKLNTTRSIQWMKDCRLVKPISVDKNGIMRLPPVSEMDAGKYTCLVHINLNGRNYTAARSIQLTIDNALTNTVRAEPELVYPQEEVVMVKVGIGVKLRCLAYIGFSEDDFFNMYWTINETIVEDHEELNDSWEYIHTNGRVFGLSTLSISKVRRWFLNVPIHCYISSTVKASQGLVWLQEDDHSAIYTTVALCLTASLAILALAPAFLLFRVDLVLAYRKLSRHFSKKQAPDGKLYDGYVSFLHPNSMSNAETADFALQILPEELEKKHGYTLYIRGRDDCPGEAMHDVIAATVRQCRRLIIILSRQEIASTDGKTEEVLSLYGDQNQLCYEHRVGLYDSLTQTDPRVILVEIDGPVDYSHLPESLRYIKRKQGALKWKQTSLGTNKLTKWCSNRNFWKNLQYYMPPVPAGICQTII